jgi:hypothetical protein
MGKKTNGWIETSEIEVDSLETNFWLHNSILDHFWWPDILPYSRVDVGYVLVFTIQGHVASSFHTDGADRKRHCKALLIILAGADLVIGY